MVLISGIAAVITLALKPLKVISRHVIYPFKVSRNVRSLEFETKRLTTQKDDVETRINNERGENGEPTAEINQWLDEVKTIEEKAAEIHQEHQQLGRCLWNIPPNPWSNYKVSRSAARKQKEVKSLCERRASIKEVMMQMASPLKQEMPTSPSSSPYLDTTLDDIRNDSYNVIGIWGMGGVGKTHLLKQVNNRLFKDGAFNVVIFVTCSKECSEKKVQDIIIDNLHLDKKDNMEQNKVTIYNFLNNRNFVLLLDDLWSHVDLEMIGIPNSIITNGTCKRKVVLTTRSTEVCGQMEVRKKIRVDVLKWEDLWSLFKEKVTEKTINSNPLIQRCVVDVVKELRGLPLALITMGRAMHDKTNPHEWEHAIEQLKNARFDDLEFSSTDKSVFRILKFSYESLENETLKQCFLHCSLWPEDTEIGKTDLIELWMGLGLIDESNIHAAYNVGYYYIRRLQARCLLEEIDGYEFDGYVKMHDVIRDMALWLANNQAEEKNKWIVKAGTSKKSNRIEISQETEKLCVMLGETEKIFLSTTRSSSKLSTLLLQQNRLCDCKPLQLDAFSELVVLNLSRNNLKAFPAEICKLVQLQFLNLSYNTFLETLLSEELAALINLQYLLLGNTYSCTIPNGVLSKLKALRVLDLYNTFLKWADGSSRIFTSLQKELQCLPHFLALDITITDMYDFQMLSKTSIVPVRNLNIESNEENCLSFASVLGNSQLQNNLLSLILKLMHVEWVKFERESREQSIYPLGRLEELTFYLMENMKEVVWMSLNPKDIFPRLQVLCFDDCPQLTSISWVARLPCIRELQVWKCKSIKQLIRLDELDNCGRMVCQPSLPYLKIIDILNNDELESISHPVITFPALEIFQMNTCNKLRRLPFKTDNPPRILILWGTEEWWNNIEFDNIAHKSTLKGSFFKM